MPTHPPEETHSMRHHDFRGSLALLFACAAMPACRESPVEPPRILDLSGIWNWTATFPPADAPPGCPVSGTLTIVQAPFDIMNAEWASTTIPYPRPSQSGALLDHSICPRPAIYFATERRSEDEVSTTRPASSRTCERHGAHQAASRAGPLAPGASRPTFPRTTPR